MTKHGVIEKALELSPADRLDVIEHLWASLDQNSADVELTDEWRAELDRRLADHRANPRDVQPWDQVKAEILASLGA